MAAARVLLRRLRGCAPPPGRARFAKPKRSKSFSIYGWTPEGPQFQSTRSTSASAGTITRTTPPPPSAAPAAIPVQERGAVAQDSTKDRAKLDGTHESILYACCSTFYPSYWWNPETYIAPAALLHSNRWKKWHISDWVGLYSLN
ncbi:hypothetical protein OPV22_021399 [Ensete ventricosum]|uniref:Uncharacterized protein n=1 Tax=Ensete ventricosum TaxID=4639 RepID=A0AAV8QH10_ENSVE|nr:hypothetical protein OPV22_021399 [Ensete ventricosum]